MDIYIGCRRCGAELRVADCDDTVETRCGFFRPGGRWTGGRRFEVRQYGGEGRVVVAFSGSVDGNLARKKGCGQGD